MNDHGTDASSEAVEPSIDRTRSSDERLLRVERIAWIVGAVLTAAIVVMVVVRAVTADWLAAGDFAVMRMRSLDVGTTDTPLVGVYSRYGWNHPGPLMFYAYAPFMRIVGGSSSGLLLGAMAVNAVSIGAVLWLARRAGAIAFSSIALVIAATVFAFGSEELFDPWNPYVMVLPLVAAGVAAWRCLAGDRVAAVVLVVAVSFAVQTHIGAAPMGVAMLAVGAFGIARSGWWRGRDRLDDAERCRARRTAWIALAVFVACWVPSILQQVFHDTSEGNLSRIWSFFLDGDESVVGIGGALRMTSRLLSLPPHLDVGWSMVPAHPGAIPWVGLLLVASTVWAWRHDVGAVRSLHVVAWVSLFAFVVGAARVAGVPYPYLFRWGWVSMALVWSAILVTVGSELARRTSSTLVSAVGAVVVSVLLAATLMVGVDMSPLDGWSDEMKAHTALVEPSLDAVGNSAGPTLLIASDQMVDGTVANQLLFEAGERGIDLKVAHDLGYVFGRHRTVEPSSARSVLTVAPRSRESELLAIPGSRVVASDDELVVILRTN